MNFLERIEDILNELVLLIWQIIKHSWFVIIPKPVRRLWRKFRLLGNWVWSYFRPTVWRLVKIFFQKMAWLWKKILDPFLRFQKAFNEVIEATVTEIKSIKVSDLTPTNIAKRFFGLILMIFAGLSYSWKQAWGNMGNQIIALSCFLLVVVGAASWKIYETSEKVYNDVVYGGRKPASAFETESKLKRRPLYYKQESRHYNLKQLRIPVYIEAENSVKIFEVDTTIEASNRYIIHFFNGNENLIRDRLLSTTEPMVHRFPLSDEGKVVMKEKIIRELDLFIEENGIEGEVKDVYFNSIVAL